MSKKSSLQLLVPMKAYAAAYNLMRAFDWASSAEGYNYWADVYTKLIMHLRDNGHDPQELERRYLASQDTLLDTPEPKTTVQNNPSKPDYSAITKSICGG